MGPDGLSLQSLPASYGQTHQKKKKKIRGEQKITTAFQKKTKPKHPNTTTKTILEDQVLPGLGTAETVAVNP